MLLNYNIYDQNIETIDFNNVKVINTINPHSYCVAKNDLDFKQALQESDVLLPDGIGIVLAERFLYGKIIKKIAGYDLFIFLMNKINHEKGSVFFLGSSKETLNKIRNNCKIDYPNISFNGYSPPFKTEFSEKESQRMIEEVNLQKPDILFVGMTAPKQEKWVYSFKNNLNVNVICSIGAVFDFYAGNTKRAPEFVVKMGLEWLHRSLNNSRLLKRNFISNPKFILDTLRYKFLKR